MAVKKEKGTIRLEEYVDNDHELRLLLFDALLFINDFAAQVYTLATDVDLIWSHNEILDLLLFLATEGASRFCCIGFGAIPCSFSGILAAEQAYAFVTDIDSAWTRDEMLHLLFILTTKRTLVYSSYSPPTEHEITLSKEHIWTCYQATRISYTSMSSPICRR